MSRAARGGVARVADVPLLRRQPVWICLLLLCWLSLAGCERRPPAAAGVPAARGVVQREVAPEPPQPLAARQVYRNVPLLGELDREEFDRTMHAMTAWVAPLTGCSHCHVDGDPASDAKPAKAQARQMLQMVQHINNNWKPHVGGTGVTCQTCHRGEAQPQAAAAAAAPANQPWAAAGARLLADINGNYLTGSAKAACSSCHAEPDAQADTRSAASTPARHPARNYPALMLLPTEHASASAAATAGSSTPGCASAANTAARSGTRLAPAQALRPVIGGDVLTLFSAPDAACVMLDLHLQPGDSVEAFVSHGGYTSVRYRRAATGSEARGWVRDDRLGPASPAASAPLDAAPKTTAAPATTAPAGLAPTANVPAGCSGTADASAAHEPLPGKARVLGSGRLQFYAAPDASCPLRGVFILPGEPVQMLQRAPGFVAVLYVNPRTGSQARGWVASQRLGAS